MDRSSSFWLARIFAVAFLLVTAWPVAAQEAVTPPGFAAAQTRWTQLLDRSQRELSALKLDNSLSERLDASLADAKTAAEALRAPVQAQVDETAELLNALGPAPAADQPAENEETAAKRKELSAALGRLQGWIAQIDLAVARADQLRDRMTARRVGLYARHLVERHASPIDPAAWSGAMREAGMLVDVVRASLASWLGRVAGPGGPLAAALGFTALLAGVGVAVGVAAGWAIRRRFGRPRLAARHALPYSRETRVSGALVEALAWALPAVLAVIVTWNAFSLADQPNAVVLAIAEGIAEGLLVFAVAAAGVRIVLAPRAPQWRIPALDDAQARSLARRMTLLAGLLGLDYALGRTSQVLASVDNLNAIWQFLLASAIALTVHAVLDRRLWPAPEAAVQPAQPEETDDGELYDPTRDDRPAPTARGNGRRILRAIGLMGVYAAPLLALAGYDILARYLYGNVIETGVVIAAAALLRSLLHDTLPVLFGAGNDRRPRLVAQFGLDDQGLRLIQFWMSLLVDLVVTMLAALAIVLVWGAERSDIAYVLNRAVEGVRVGPITLSLTDLLLAAAVFTGVMMATRLVTHTLDTRVFPGSQLDPGVQNSLRSGVGYAGLLLGVALAVSTMGLNLANLALVVGALTVGIGFGLQNIVNNFVSGLILLIERPIKAGDWIVVGDKQGIVRRIRIRATEIETFQRASVLIPNGDFLSHAVINWTHRNTQGRLDVPITVNNVTDARATADLLLACVRRQPGIAAMPRPHLLLRNFTGDSYQFEIRAYLDNVYRMDEVGSELRFALDAALRGRRQSAAE